MLYIKFTIQNQDKYQDFQKLYNHLIMVRKEHKKYYGFDAEEDYDEDDDNFNWDTATQEEINNYLETISFSPQEKRYNAIVPKYSQEFLSEVGEGVYGFSKEEIMICLEHGFEVNLTNLEKLNDTTGLVEYEALGFPLSGTNTFLMTLKAYGLLPTECFNGFTVYQFNWTSKSEHEVIELPNKTEQYKAGKNIHKVSFWNKLLAVFNTK